MPQDHLRALRERWRRQFLPRSQPVNQLRKNPWIPLRSAPDHHRIRARDIEGACETLGAAHIPAHNHRNRDGALHLGNRRIVRIAAVELLARALDITGADAVMIGRGAQGNPWIFPQLIHWLHTGAELPPPTLAERARVILRHLDLLVGYKGEYIGIREMRKHAAWYTRGLKGSAELRERFNRAASREEFAGILHTAWDI